VSNTVVRPLVPEDYPAVKEIVTESFGADLPEDVRQPFFQALKRYEEEPWYDPEHLLVAEVDGEVVSQMGVRTGRLSLGGAASVPAALVGTVCTRASHRGQGIGSEMMRSAFGWMARFGPAVSYLHTSTERHGFYGRLGYRKAIMSCPRLMVDPHRMGLSAASPPVRDATAADRELIGSIYTAQSGGRSVRLVQRHLGGSSLL